MGVNQCDGDKNLLARFEHVCSLLMQKIRNYYVGDYVRKHLNEF